LDGKELSLMSHANVRWAAAPRLFESFTFWTFARGATAAAAVWVLLTAWGRWGIPDVDAADPLMYTNAGNLLFWVVWMMGLVLLAPIAGRVWCGICPLGTLNEISSRWGLSRPFPRALRNSYLKAGALVGTVLLIGLVKIHHFPGATAYFLGAWAALAVIMGLVFAGRSLCSYACPVGGMLALYGRAAPIVMGVRDRDVCVSCAGRECVKGSEQWLQMGLARLRSALRIRRHPCPVNLRVWEMEGTERCLFCFNCLRACPLDNVIVSLRRPVSAIWRERFPRLSEIFMAAAVMGFLLLSYSRFWPALENAVALPVAGLAGPAGPHLSRPLYLVWAGFVLPLILLLIPSAFARWGKALARNSASEPGFDRRAGGNLPVRFWVAGDSGQQPAGDRQDDEERILADAGSVPGLAAVLLPAVIPTLLGGHLALAVVKLNAKLGYLGLAAADPSGIKTYMAVEELGLVPRPGLLLSLPAVRIAAVIMVGAGIGLSVLSVLNIVKREELPALPYLVQIALIGSFFTGGLIQWLF
jgi:polyferredoxin